MRTMKLPMFPKRTPRRLAWARAAALAVAVGACAAAPPAVVLETPLEREQWSRLTTHAEVLEFAEELGRTSSRITTATLGTSVEGRRIPYFRISLGEFGADRARRPIVLIFAQQHGNEPSGKEGALLLARDVAAGGLDDVLRHVDLLLVPQVNPDGGDAHRRPNAEGVDLNRSHLILNGVEAAALRDLFHEWEPEVTLDVHEYGPWTGAWLERGWLRLFDEQIGLSTNLNTHESLRRLAEDRLLPDFEARLNEQGFTTHNYIVGSPDGIRFSTTDINDGRQGFGILNGFSFIVEGKNGRGDPADNIQRRAEGQRAAMEALLRFVARNRAEVLSTVRAARAEVVEGRVREFVLTMSREPDGQPLRIPVQSVSRATADGEWVVGDTIIAEIEMFSPLVKAGRTTTLPAAYLVPASEPAVIALLERHRVEMRRLAAGDVLDAEAYMIGGSRVEVLEDAVAIATVEVTSLRHTAAEGDVLVPTAQLRGLLVATALEPESMHGLAGYDAFGHLRRPGQYPILRIPTIEP
jgi:hypothetical protein